MRRKPFIQWQAPLVWSTLQLTLFVDRPPEFEVIGASRFPRHWFYDGEGRLAAKSGLTDYKDWYRKSFGKHTPWGDQDSPALVTAVETALERALSQQMMGQGAKPEFRKVGAGTELVTQGEAGTDVFLVLDGVVRVERDGERLAEFGPGAVLGERAGNEGGTRTSTLVAVTDSPGGRGAPPRHGPGTARPVGRGPPDRRGPGLGSAGPPPRGTRLGPHARASPSSATGATPRVWPWPGTASRPAWCSTPAPASGTSPTSSRVGPSTAASSSPTSTGTTSRASPSARPSTGPTPAATSTSRPSPTARRPFGVLARMMSPPNFPIDPDGLRGRGRSRRSIPASGASRGSR